MLIRTWKRTLVRVNGIFTLTWITTRLRGKNVQSVVLCTSSFWKACQN